MLFVFGLNKRNLSIFVFRSWPIFYDFFVKKTPFAAEKIESGSHDHPPYFNTCEQIEIERERGRGNTSRNSIFTSSRSRKCSSRSSKCSSKCRSGSIRAVVSKADKTRMHIIAHKANLQDPFNEKASTTDFFMSR